MRWEALFDDLENQVAAQQAEETRRDVAERIRSERVAIELSSRVIASVSRTITLTVADGSRLRGKLSDAASTWMLLADEPHEHLIPLDAVCAIEGLAAHAERPDAVEERLSLGHVLRALARDRARVRAGTLAGERVGVIAAVGRDHVDMVLDGAGRVTVPFGALTRVSRL